MRKLVAVEMAALGTQLAVSLYALGIVLPLVFGLFSLVLNFSEPHPAGWQVALGFWMISISANYVPLLAHALSFVKTDTARREGEPELVRAARYGSQQVIVLIPLLVVALALVQARQDRQVLP